MAEICLLQLTKDCPCYYSGSSGVISETKNKRLYILTEDIVVGDQNIPPKIYFFDAYELGI